MNSIMQKNKECYLCRKLVGDYTDLPSSGLEDHHILNGVANRPISERFGLKIWLCHKHHMDVHKDAKLRRSLKAEAQKRFMEKDSIEEWMELFGENFL